MHWKFDSAREPLKVLHHSIAYSPSLVELIEQKDNTESFVQYSSSEFAQEIEGRMVVEMMREKKHKNIYRMVPKLPTKAEIFSWLC